LNVVTVVAGHGLGSLGIGEEREDGAERGHLQLLCFILHIFIVLVFCYVSLILGLLTINQRPFPLFEEGVTTTSKRIFRTQWITGFTATPDLAFVFLDQTRHPFQFIALAFDHRNTHSTVQQHVITICRHFENIRAIVDSKNCEE